MTRGKSGAKSFGKVIAQETEQERINMSLKGFVQTLHLLFMITMSAIDQNLIPHLAGSCKHPLQYLREECIAGTGQDERNAFGQGAAYGLPYPVVQLPYRITDLFQGGGFYNLRIVQARETMAMESPAYLATS